MQVRSLHGVMKSWQSFQLDSFGMVSVDPAGKRFSRQLLVLRLEVCLEYMPFSGDIQRGRTASFRDQDC